MTTPFTEFISAVLQIIAFCIIPFIFFLFRRDKSVSFTRYVGFYKPPAQSIVYVLLASLLFVAMGIGLIFFNEGVRQMVMTPPSVTGKLRLAGFSASSLVTLLIIAWLKTSLSEELFFRGFLAKRLITLLGFSAGNLLQALIFGIIHFVLFWQLTQATWIPLVVIFVFSTGAGWTMGFVKEKVAHGSIISGWISHGLGNSLSYAIIAYVI